MGIFQRQQIIKFLATGFYSGYSPIAPGTTGSLVGILIYTLLQNLSDISYIAITVLIFGIGVYISDQAEGIYQKKDCSNIVIDEIAGMLVSLAFFQSGHGGIKITISGFILFRIFDIIKPFPVRTIDRKLGGGWGIMLDDIMAGVYANISLRVLIFISPSLDGRGLGGG